MTPPEVTALLPMKGDSERVRGKNMRLLGGKPLFHHVLESLLAVPAIAEVIVDTDSPAIATSASAFPRVRVLDRPSALLGAKVPMTPIIAHDLGHASTPHFLQTHATNPLLTSATIARAIDTYFAALAGGSDSLLAVTAYQTRFYDSQGRPVNHDPHVMVPSQDMPLLYEDNSNFYLMPVETFRRVGRRVGERPLFFPISRLEGLDIDEEEDFELVEAVYRHRRQSEAAV